MVNAFNGILSAYGEETLVTENGATQNLKTFIQPVLSKNDDGDTDITPIGKKDTSIFYWFCPNTLNISDKNNTVITAGGTDYIIIKLKPYRFKGAISHFEGVLALREEDYSD